MTTDLRTRILDAAIKLLETEGSKAFGQTRIARAAGVKQGNITYHFPKKADLVAAVVERVNERRLADLQDLGERADKIEPEKLRALLFERLASMATEIKRSRVMLALLIEAEHDPEISKLMTAVTNKQRAVLATLLRREPGDLELELVLAMLSGLSLHVLGSEHASGASSGRVEALLRRFRHWLPTLLAPASEPTPAKAPPEQARPARVPPARRRRTARATPRPVRASPA